MSQQPYYDPDEATLAAARRIRIYRSLKFLPYAIIVLIFVGFVGGIYISRQPSTPDFARVPDRRYADLACGSSIRGVSIPPEGYQLPNFCRTVISVNAGAVRVFQGEGMRTFDMGASTRSNPGIIDRVFSIEGWTNIDIITLPRGQTTYGDDDYKRDHPPSAFGRYQ